MGVKHWYGCLALVNPELEGVSVKDPKLSLETKAIIDDEMFSNHWFFFREIVNVPQDGTIPGPFLINRGTFALLWSFFNNIDFALLMIRQQGKSIVILCLIVYLTRILKNSRTILLTKDAGLRIEHVRKLKDIRDTIPKYLWLPSKNPPDADNTETFTYNTRGNKLITCIGQNNEAGAENGGRGMTAARLKSDETAYTPFIRSMLPAALGATGTARKIAEAAGIPFGNSFTTTPGKRDDPDGKYVYDLFHNGYYWDESLLDVGDRDKVIEIILNNCTGDRVLLHGPFTHRQLGISDLELYQLMANATGTYEQKLRDYGMQWTAGTLSSPLTREEIDRIDKSKSQPLYKEIFPKGWVLNWYYKENEIAEKLKVKHIVGLDTSDGIGRDSISLVIINSETLELAAESVVKETNLVIYTDWLVNLLVKYLNLILVIERKSSAPTMIDTLLIRLPLAGIDPARRMYNTIIQNREDNDHDLNEFLRIVRPKDESFYALYRKYFGFNTSGSSRDDLYGDVLKNAIKVAGSNIRSTRLCAELLGLVIKNERIDHKASGHDDTVIAWLLACWFMFHGRRLDYYGVSNRALAKRQLYGDNALDIDDADLLAEEEAQQELSDEIYNLCTQIATNRNPFLKTSLERTLRVKLSKLKLDTSQATTISELQELVRKDKLHKRFG